MNLIICHFVHWSLSSCCLLHGLLQQPPRGLPALSASYPCWVQLPHGHLSELLDVQCCPITIRTESSSSVAAYMAWQISLLVPLNLISHHSAPYSGSATLPPSLTSCRPLFRCHLLRGLTTTLSTTAFLSHYSTLLFLNV